MKKGGEAGQRIESIYPLSFCLADLLQDTSRVHSMSARDEY